MAAIGRQLKQSVKVFHSLMLYLLLPKKKNQFRNQKCSQILTKTTHRNWYEAPRSVNWEKNLLLTLIVEAIYSVDRCTFVVSPQQEEVFRIFDFVGQQETDGLQRLFPPVNIVTQKQVVALWREAAIFKQPQQVIILSMDITCRAKVRSVHLRAD